MVDGSISSWSAHWSHLDISFLGLICGTWRLERLAEPDEKPPLATSPQHLHLGSAHHAMPGRARFPPVSAYDASPRPQFRQRQTWTMRRSRTNFLPRSCCCSWSTSSHRPGSHGEGEGGEKRRRRKGRRQGLTGGLQLGRHVSKTGSTWAPRQGKTALEWIESCVSHGFDI